MALDYQFNKIAMLQLQRQLATRLAALPTLKSKESVLRLAIQRQKTELESLAGELERCEKALQGDLRLWAEFPYTVFSLKRIETRQVKIAGVSVPELSGIVWENREFSKFNKPVWIATGVAMLKDLATVQARRDIAAKALEILEKARRRTTQKVNLYEKVQIPEYRDAVRKINRSLEDVENLEKSAQKLVKQRQEEAS